MTTQDKDLILKPNGHSFVCYVNADFQGGWDIKTAAEDSTTAKSQTAYMSCKGVVQWYGHQDANQHFTFDHRKRILGSVSTRGTLVEGTNDQSERVDGTGYQCTIFEDNEGAKAMATVPKMRPRTKHINGQMHHFWSAVSSRKRAIESIDTSNQLANLGTMPLAKDLFT
jgi:hypothetical protein